MTMSAIEEHITEMGFDVRILIERVTKGTEAAAEKKLL
jgi:hypothetical protein